MITIEMLNAATPICGYVWASPEGQWLTFSEQTTHTGTHRRLGLTNDINQAFVGWRLPKFNETAKGVPHPNKFTPINASEQCLRIVRITPPTDRTLAATENRSDF